MKALLEYIARNLVDNPEAVQIKERVGRYTVTYELTVAPDETGKVIGAKTEDTVTGEAGYLETDGVFVFVGHLPNNDLYQGKLHLDEDGHLITDSKMRTNIPGVFAAGEIMDKVYKQVATSVGQGCAAAMQAERFLAELDAEGYHGFEDPRAFYYLEHSLV